MSASRERENMLEAILNRISIFRRDKDCHISRSPLIIIGSSTAHKSQRPHFDFQILFNNDIGLQASFTLAFV